jgi:hypothetical protein
LPKQENQTDEKPKFEIVPPQESSDGVSKGNYDGVKVGIKEQEEVRVSKSKDGGVIVSKARKNKSKELNLVRLRRHRREISQSLKLNYQPSHPRKILSRS